MGALALWGLTFGTPLTYSGQDFNYYLSGVVPEPGTMALIAGGLLLALGRGRRR